MRGNTPGRSPEPGVVPKTVDRRVHHFTIWVDALFYVWLCAVLYLRCCDCICIGKSIVSGIGMCCILYCVILRYCICGQVPKNVYIVALWRMSVLV